MTMSHVLIICVLYADIVVLLHSKIGGIFSLVSTFCIIWIYTLTVRKSIPITVEHSEDPSLTAPQLRLSEGGVLS